MMISIFVLPSLGFTKGGGNGGKVVACSWRDPIVLDYYELFMGNLEVEPLSNSITPIKMELSTITEDNFIQSFSTLIDETINYHNKNVKNDSNVNRVHRKNQKEIKDILKTFRNTFAEISTYFPKLERWNLGQYNVYTTRDSGENYSLPSNCSLQQIANYRFQGGSFGVYVNEKLFRNLPYEQKIILYFHELFLEMGKKYYGHEDAFFTRKMIRFIAKEFNIQNPLSVILKNSLIRNIYEFANQISWMGHIYSEKNPEVYFPNLLDIEGKFHLLHDKKAANFPDDTGLNTCPRNIEIKNYSNLLNNRMSLSIATGEGRQIEFNFTAGGILTGIADFTNNVHFVDAASDINTFDNFVINSNGEMLGNVPSKFFDGHASKILANPAAPDGAPEAIKTKYVSINSDGVLIFVDKSQESNCIYERDR
jgi:hypothetical protein